MRQRLKLFLVIFTWLMATGSQWDLLQVAAWGRMFANYSNEMSLSAAAKKTLSGEMCGVCVVAQDGKKQQESSGDNTLPGKISGKMLDLSLLAEATPIFSPVSEPVGVVLPVVNLDGRGRASPPSPPPRV